ncbi:MAG: ATP-binding protein [bacterium]|nr:ATP-binding protein [bacterium]
MKYQSLDDFKKVLKFSKTTGDKIISREGSALEFKESFDWRSKDRYGKSAAALANRHGGYMVFGVKDAPKELVGLKTENFEETDEAKIAQYLNSTFSPEIEFEKEVRQIRGKKIGVIFFPISKKKPVVAIKNDGDIKEGEIYYRYTARTDKIKFPELRVVLDQIQETERRHWMELFAKISQVGPENIAVMNVVEGRIDGRGGTVIIDHKLLPKLKFIKEGSFREKGRPVLRLVGDVRPVSFANSKKTLGGGVRITDDPTAPVVRLQEENVLKEFSLDFSTLTARLRERYTNFKADNKYLRLRREFMGRGFSITRKLNPQNPKSPQQHFYTPQIIKEFDKNYIKK